MQKIYLLLRNNKQSGPYTLNELVGLPLKPKDLLWVEGKSKSWAHPSTMDELKAFVTEEENQADSQVIYPESNKKLVLPRTSPIKKDDSKPEAIKVQVYVKLPESYKTVPDSAGKLAAEDGDRSGVNDMENYSLSTKYVRDLDDIKAQYAEWIGKQKSNPEPGLQKNKLIFSFIVIVVVIAGFMAERWGASANSANITLKADSVQVIRKPSATPPVKPSKKKKVNAADLKKDKKKKTAIVSEEGTTRQKEEIEDTKNNDADKERIVVKAEKKPDAATLFQQLDIEYSRDSTVQGLTAFHFILHNGSSFKLATVGLTVYYNDKNGKLLYKESIYFNNLHPGGTGVQKAPAHEHVASVNYKIAMVSVNDAIFHAKE